MLIGLLVWAHKWDWFYSQFWPMKVSTYSSSCLSASSGTQQLCWTAPVWGAADSCCFWGLVFFCFWLLGVSVSCWRLSLTGFSRMLSSHELLSLSSGGTGVLVTCVYGLFVLCLRWSFLVGLDTSWSSSESAIRQSEERKDNLECHERVWYNLQCSSKWLDLLATRCTHLEHHRNDSAFVLPNSGIWFFCIY